VLLDEPFTGMDAVTRERAENYIRHKQEGRILIIATHI
jgi:ABC-type multidrug transport system ATPase subunit